MSNIMVSDTAKSVRTHRPSRHSPTTVADAGKRLVGIVALGDVAIAGSDVEVAGETLCDISQPG